LGKRKEDLNFSPKFSVIRPWRRMVLVTEQGRLSNMQFGEERMTLVLDVLGWRYWDYGSTVVVSGEGLSCTLYWGNHQTGVVIDSMDVSLWTDSGRLD
jgi:hypothetical protein